MSLRSLLLLIVGAAIVAFVAVNWVAVTQPTTLSLGFTEVVAPLGVVLLGLTALLALVFIGIIAYMQTTVIMEARRHNKELAAQRELADNAEASRFTDLRAFLTTELGRLAEQAERNNQALHSRVDRLEVGLREATPTTELAHLADVSDRHNQELHARIDRLEIGLRELDAHRQPAAMPALPGVATAPRAAAPTTAASASAAPEVHATFVHPHINPLEDVRSDGSPLGTRRD